MVGEAVLSGKYAAYPEHKDSGIDWIGETPVHWLVKPLFSIAATESIKNTSGQEKNVLSLSYGNIIPRDVETNFGLLPASFNTYQLVNPGDLVLRLTDLQNDKRSLRVGHAKQSGIITSAYLKLTARSTEIDNRYFYLLLHSYDTTKVFYGMGGGLRQSMTFEEMRRLTILIPTLQEQKIIANFLDHETAKIDTLIDKQQQLIQLLKEKRQAVISHAVTKGLNPNAPMRDSGVEWLGEVPEHWVVTQLKYICKLIDGDRGAAYPNEADLVDEGIPFVSSKNIVHFKLTKKNLNYITSEKFTALGRGKLAENDLVITVRGTIGHVGVFDPEIIGCSTGFINAQMMIMRPKKGLTDYLQFVSESLFWTRQLDIAAYGSTVRQLSNEILGNIIVAVPPAEELQNLIKTLRFRNDRHEDLIGKAEMAISLMQERRTALISAAVTGKIDVRHHVSRPSGNDPVGA